MYVHVVHMCSHLFNVFMAFSGSAQNTKKINIKHNNFSAGGFKVS